MIMMYYKRKKNIRLRGSKTHGWGSMKKHRGAGNRGGRGMAGTGKRGDAKKPSIWKDKKYFGKHGFKSKRKPLLGINVADLEQNLDKFINMNLIKQEKNVFVVELGKLGYEKLLGKGRVTKGFKVTVKRASKNAVEKIKKAGGEVTLLEKTSEKETED